MGDDENMTDIEVLKAEVRAIGQYWRNDWSSFDGRELRDQINKAIDNFEHETDLYHFRDLLAEQIGKM
ncbi:MAG: hypothetical protein PHH85_09025 [Candidatus Methanoperedens sp.]|nr:hypothetical protein [Candidatus Methanoperedens sp.]